MPYSCANKADHWQTIAEDLAVSNDVRVRCRNQAITRFDRWSMSAMEMFRQPTIGRYQILLNSTTRQSPPDSPPGGRTATQLPSYPVFE
jgi:hypothetical protein